MYKQRKNLKIRKFYIKCVYITLNRNNLSKVFIKKINFT